MRKVVVACLMMLSMMLAQGQGVENPCANVAAYSDDEEIVRMGYRESPYYMELSGRWGRRETDSSTVYRRSIDVGKTWREYRTMLNVRCGRGCRVYVDGKVVGYATDSRQWNQFCLDKYLKYGKSVQLEIEAMRYSDGALLEDTTTEVGLNGEPFILFKSDPGVEDMTITADYDASTGIGTMSVDVTVLNSKRKGKYYVEAEIIDPKGHQLDRMGRWVVFGNKSEETVDMSRSWPSVQAWNAEQPALYTLVVRLRNEKLEEEEMVGGRFGFRRVEWENGRLIFNGKQITLKGVTYGLRHTEGFASRQQMLRDVKTMKENNINAVRTARYSPMDAYFYELCDEYGLYVVADANLQPLSTEQRVAATEADLMPLFERRVENLYHSYKNHTSIIAWSLGNTTDNGVCMTASYRRLKAIEKNRPVVFAGAGQGEMTDVVALMKPTVQSLKQTKKRDDARPTIMLESADGKGFADLGRIWSEVDGGKVQGGFVSGWPLTAVQLADVAQLYSPFDVSLAKLTPDGGEFVVYNRQDFSGFEKYLLEYTIYTNLRPNIVAGDLAVAASGGGSDKVSMLIPDISLGAGEEMYIRFDLGRRATRTSSKGIVGSKAIAIEQQGQTKKMLHCDGVVKSAPTQRAMLRFAGHADFEAQLVDSIGREAEGGTRCIDVMWRYVDAGGATVCDVRSTEARYCTGDVVVEYNISNTARGYGELMPEVVIDGCDGDSVVWYGLGREVAIRSNNSADVGQYGRRKADMTRQEVRWCSVYGATGGVFARILDQNCTMKVEGNSIALTPTEKKNIRLHLSPYSGEAVGEMLATEYPKVSAGILQPPTITASEARFAQPLTVTIEAATKGEIRYTLDGSEPSRESALYKTPIQLTTTTTVKARLFADKMSPSFTATRRFNYDYIVRTSLSRNPNTPYNSGVDTILFDGLYGEIDDLAHGWLGFSGAAAVVTVDLSKTIKGDVLTLRFAHAPAVWAFAPEAVEVSFSDDGKTFADTVRRAVWFDPSDQENSMPQVVEMEIPLEGRDVSYIRIEPKTIERLPAWHRGKGLKPWLMMDEIKISEK